MNFHVLTLFPEMIRDGFETSITGRAVEKGLLSLETVNIRDFSVNKHNRVDDYPYGGGAGMVMQAEPVYLAWESVVERLGRKPKVLYMSPQGRVFDQTMAQELAEEEDLLFLCGHYEGIDERIIDDYIDEQISIGDYVLTGGELPALVMADAICRMLPDVLSDNVCFEEESHYNGLLEYPQYTRPANFRGKEVPAVLLSGHHANIQRWRREQSLLRTAKYRPDLIEKAKQSGSLTDEDLDYLSQIADELEEK